MNIDIKLSASDVADAVKTTIDGISQTRQRLALKELEIVAESQKLTAAEQQAKHAQTMADLEQEKERLAIEEKRLAILEKTLEVRQKAVESSLIIAGRMVDQLQPGLDPAAKAMAMQAILPEILQLQMVPMELRLPSQTQNNEKETE